MALRLRLPVDRAHEFARVAYCRREHAIEVSKRRWPDKPWAMEDFHFGGGRWINGSLQVNKKPPLGGGKHLSRSLAFYRRIRLWQFSERSDLMTASVIVWDIETVPDLRGFAAAKGLTGRSDDEVRAEMGDKFPKLIYHSILCIGALVAQRESDHWSVMAIGAPSIAERSEKEIIERYHFVLCRSNRRLISPTRDIQRRIIRSAGAPLSGYGLWSGSAGIEFASILQPIYRRRDSLMRRALLVQLPKQSVAARPVPCHGIARKARRY